MNRRAPRTSTLITLVVAMILGSPVSADDSLRGPGVITVDGVCTLADAIRSANTDSDVGSCSGASGADTIVLDVDTVISSAAIDSTVEDGTPGALPDVTSEMTIQAGTSVLIARDAALGCSPTDDSDHFRLLHVASTGALTLNGVTIENGCAVRGGALNADGDLVVESSIFRFNTARSIDAPAPPQVHGGAIYVDSEGSLTLTDSIFFVNMAIGGEGSEVPMSPGGSSAERQGFQGGDGFGATAFGGAISVAGPSTNAITGTTFLGNAAIGGDGTQAGGSARGGAIRGNSFASLDGCVFRMNTAVGGNGPGGGDAEGGALFVNSATPTSATDLVFVENTAIGGAGTTGNGGDADGGAISSIDLELTGARFTSNEAVAGDSSSGGVGGDGSGGAVRSNAVDLVRVTADDNIAWGGDGIAGGGAALGGAISTDVLMTRAVTIYRNFALGGDFLGTLGAGTADFLGDPAGPAEGGGVRFADGQLHQATIVRNVAVGGAGPGMTVSGGGVYFLLGMATVRSSILAGNYATFEGVPVVANDCDAVMPAGLPGGRNLVETPGTCTFADTGDQTGSDPLLEDFGQYPCTSLLPDGSCPGALPPTLASPVVDQGTCTGGDTTDIRGTARPFDEVSVGDFEDGCDIGAYEYTDLDDNDVDDGVDAGVVGIVFGDGFESGTTEAWSSSVP